MIFDTVEWYIGWQRVHHYSSGNRCGGAFMCTSTFDPEYDQRCCLLAGDRHCSAEDISFCAADEANDGWLLMQTDGRNSPSMQPGQSVLL